jgi:hypothetical protein
MKVECGEIALLTTGFQRVAGKRLLYRPLTGRTDAPPLGWYRLQKAT